MLSEEDRRRLEEIEDGLRLRVQEAVSELRRTVDERTRLCSIAADAPETRDGAFAVRQAIDLHLQALKKLRRALDDFQAFTSRRP